MVAEHPNELVRDQYLVTVSDRTAWTSSACGLASSGSSAPLTPRASDLGRDRVQHNERAGEAG